MQTPEEVQRLTPPFTLETAARKVQMAEDAWNSRDPERVALAYSADSEWRNRTEFVRGRNEIKAFLRRKWAKELDYRLKKTLWLSMKIGLRSASNMSGTTGAGQWYRSYGNEFFGSSTMTG